MEVGFVFVVAALVAVVVWVLLRIPRGVNLERAGRTFEMVAPRVSGKVVGSALEFTRRGYPARVVMAGGMNRVTEVTYCINGGIAGTLSVSTETLHNELSRQLGFGDVMIGDPAFDERFLIMATEPSLPGRYLRGELKKLLMEYGRAHDFLFRITPHVVTFRVYSHLYNWSDLESFLGMTMQAFDLLDLAPQGDVVFDTVAGPAEVDAKCEICGGLLSKGVVVRCAKCNTPHHKDCWVFNGLCATFACGGKTFNG